MAAVVAGEWRLSQKRVRFYNSDLAVAASAALPDREPPGPVSSPAGAWTEGS
jgi:hypothetical protein